MPFSMTATVSDRRGVVLARSAEARRYVGTTLPSAGRAPTESGREGWVRTTDIAGVPVVLAFTRSAVAGWTAAVFTPEAVFEAPLRRSLWVSAALGALLAALAATLAVVFARGIARPIAALTDIAAQNGGTGVASSATPVREVNEVGQALAAARRASMQREQEREDLLLTLDRAQVLIRNPDGTITVWTSGVEQLYGWTRAEAVGRLWHELLRTKFPRPLPEIETELLARGEWQGELHNCRRDGTEVVVASRWALRRRADGEPLAVAESFNDITGLRAAEAELRHSRDLLASVVSGSADPIFAKAFGCVLLDLRMPGMDGLAVQREMAARGIKLPVVVVTAHGDVALAVQAMKAGACDFIEKPYDADVILQAAEAALARGDEERARARDAEEAASRVAALTPREAEVLQGLVAGQSNKVIAFDLGVSPRTVEVHRANLMAKLGARNLSEAVRIALSAGLRAGRVGG